MKNRISQSAWALLLAAALAVGAASGRLRTGARWGAGGVLYLQAAAVTVRAVRHVAGAPNR